jgi:hypothetical protein
VPVEDRDRVRIDVVEAVEVDGDVVAADLLQVAAPEAVDASAAAEAALRDLGAPLGGRQLPPARDQAEGGGARELKGASDTLERVIEELTRRQLAPDATIDDE